MEEIKVGEYVRTDNGIIGMYTKYRGVEDTIETNNKFIGFDIEKDIIKHSSDIKDLVQVGDIILYNVNSKMTDIEIVKEHIDARTLEKTLRVGIWSLEQVEIKEILTKEQFDSRKYIVGDESNEM